VRREGPGDRAVIVSSGRGVHEALAAATLCHEAGLPVGVVDMPSIDEALLLQLVDSGRLVCLAEQNNGYILQNLCKLVYRHRASASDGLSRVMAINALDSAGRPQFIHSGTYEQLIDSFGLSAPAIARAVANRLDSRVEGDRR
jgi:transketolase C-terminal domain/subunit